jgi:hypothetical protein
MVESYQQKDHMVTNAIITEDINYAIENGVKEVNAAYKNPNSYHHKWTIDNVLENGVKEIKGIKDTRTNPHGYFNTKDSTYTPMTKVQDVIENGVKE